MGSAILRRTSVAIVRNAGTAQLRQIDLYRPTLTTRQFSTPNMLVSLTVGKVDAGVAVLLTEDKRLVCLPNTSTGHGSLHFICG